MERQLRSSSWTPVALLLAAAGVVGGVLIAWFLRAAAVAGIEVNAEDNPQTYELISAITTGHIMR